MTPRRADYLALAALGLFYLAFGLGSYGLLHNNEGLYAEIAREMLESGSFIIPTLNGVPYLEKPPLLPWLLASVYAFFGPSELALRAVPAAAALVLITATVHLAREHAGPQVAWLSGLILVSSVLQVFVYRTLLPDVLLTACFALAMLNFLRWHTSRRTASLVTAYAFLGIAVLAKGFLALVLGPLIFLLFWLWAKPPWRLSELAHPWASALLAMLAFSWPILLTGEDRDFGWFFVVNEHLLRFLDLREPKDYYIGPLYYYLPRIVLFALPWSLFLPLLALRRRVSEVEKFAWTWFGVCLAFFSISRAKGNYYMTLGVPPLALLLALALASVMEQGRHWGLALMSAVAAAVAAVVLWALEARFWMSAPRGIWITVLRLDKELALTVLAVAALTVAAAVLFALRRNRAALYAWTLAGAPVLAFVLVLVREAEPFLSGRSLGEYVRAEHPSAKVYLFQDYENLSSVPFYLRQQVAIVESASNDLAFGHRERPNHENFISAAQLRSVAASQEFILLVHRRRLPAYRATLGDLGLTSRKRVGNVTVFSNYH